MKKDTSGKSLHNDMKAKNTNINAKGHLIMIMPGFL